MADDAGTYTLGIIASNERVAKVLVQLHLQLVGIVILLIIVVIIIVIRITVTFILLFLLIPATQPFFASNQNTSYHRRNDKLLISLFLRCLVVLLVMETVTTTPHFTVEF